MKCNKSFAVALMKVVGCVALACCALTVARAEDKVDPTGTWFWVQAGRNGGPDRTNTLTLKMEGDAIKGSIAGPPGRNGNIRKTEISDAKMTGNEISFKTTAERGGNTTTTTYTGKITADGIEGTIKAQSGDADPRTRPWKAKKQTSGS